MKRLAYIYLILLLTTTYLNSTTVNGRILVSSVTDSTANIKLQLNTDTGNDDFGGSTIIIKFDCSQIAYPEFPQHGIDYVFHNLSGGNYDTAFLTRPRPNEIWLNISLLTDNNGSIVPQFPGWMDVATITMILLNNQGLSSISLNTESAFWIIYDGNNSTVWNTGEWSTITNINNSGILPTEYTLNQNFPNPFNPQTTISFSLPVSAEVKLSVFNLLGERVDFLVNENLHAGNHHVTFNADKLPSGVYVYQLAVKDKFIETKKMVLIK